jgi:hypothetical protein
VTDERDETIDRLAAALREMPQVDSAAKARVLVAVAAERERDRERAAARRPWRRALGLVAGAAAAGLVVSATVRLVGRAPTSNGATAGAVASATPPRSSAAAGGGALAARSSDDAGAPQPVELVLRAPTAHTVRVVGDFTGWREDGPLMRRDEASGLWSVTLAVRPGRHVYAFLVDDSVWTRDPRAPIANDADFGRPGSVLLVGRP